jgi:hypothetical protein
VSPGELWQLCVASPPGLDIQQDDVTHRVPILSRRRKSLSKIAKSSSAEVAEEHFRLLKSMIHLASAGLPEAKAQPVSTQILGSASSGYVFHAGDNYFSVWPASCQPEW